MLEPPLGAAAATDRLHGHRAAPRGLRGPARKILPQGWRGYSRPVRSARAAAWTRPDTPSLRKMLLTRTPAVLGLMYSSAPIWALVRPAASSRSTASSRPVSP